MIRRVAIASLALLAGPALAAEPKPGSYCPLPAAGEVPQCLSGAQTAYADFFSGLSDGELTDAQTSQLETDLAAADHPSYDALSALTFGYYRLAQQAAEAGEDSDNAAIAARLEHWNQLLAQTYETHRDAPYRAAVRTAAGELRERAPVRLACRDADGHAAECTSTEAVLRGMRDARDRTGVRGALARLLERFFASDPETP